MEPLIHKLLQLKNFFTEPSPFPAIGVKPTPSQLEQEVMRAIYRQFEDVNPDKIKAITLFEELEATRLDLVEIAMALDEKFGLEDAQSDHFDHGKIKTVGQLIQYYAKLLELA